MDTHLSASDCREWLTSTWKDLANNYNLNTKLINVRPGTSLQFCAAICPIIDGGGEG